MALHLLFRYDFVATVGAYSAGDWIESYYNDVTGNINAYDESGVIITGPNLGVDVNEVNFQVPPATYRTTEEGYSFCQSTTLVYFGKYTSFPYALKRTQVNAPSCAVTTPVCDLKVSITKTTGASDKFTADGEIVSVATSSATGIKYGLFDFDYATQGQTSGTFSGLYPATYTVWVKDANGCQDGVTVLVGVADATYGVRFRHEYKTIDGELRKVDILESGYAGAVVEVDGGADPCRIIWRGEETAKTYPVIASTLEVDLFNSVAMGNFYYQDLFTQDDQKFKVIQYKHNGSSYVENWQGFITPSLYSEPYVPLPYTVTIQCSDNLPILAEKLFLDSSGNSFRYNLSILEVIAICLEKTGINLNIRIACHIFEELQSNLSTTTPLEQTYVQVTSYLDEEGNPKTCREVLEYVLAPFVARICQVGGYWYIVRIEELKDDFNYVEFSYDGIDITQTGTGSHSPVKNIRRGTTSNSATPSENSLSMDTVPAYGKVRINYELGYLGGLLKYGSFEEPKYVTGLVIEGAIEGVPGSGIPVETEGAIVDRHFAPEWTLVNDGDTGGVNVTFKKVKDEGYVASIQNGNGDSYITYTPIPLSYTSSDTLSIRIRFKLSKAIVERTDRTPTNTVQTSGPRQSRTSAGSLQTVDPPFTKVKWSAKLGTRYLLQYGGGTTDETTGINENYIETYNEFVDIKLDNILLPDVQSPTTETLTIKIYSVNPLDSDVRFFTQSALILGLKAIDTTELYLGKKVILTEPGDFGVILYYVLENGTDAEDDPNVIRPTDYDVSTNPKVWKLIAKYTNNSVARYYNSIDLSEVQIEFYPGGITPIGSSGRTSRGNNTDSRSFIINDVEIKKDLVTPYSVNAKIRNELDVNFFHGDLPTIQNAKYIYENFFLLSDGTPTQKWKRDNIDELLPIHRIAAEQIIEWYRKPTWRLSGTLKVDTTMGDISPIDCMYTSTQEQKYYLIKSLTCYDKDKQYQVEMEEIGDNEAEPGRGFSIGFTTGFNA